MKRCIDEISCFCHIIDMKKLRLIFVIAIAPLTLGSVAQACDMHGAGFGGFGFSTASWEAYAPTVSTTDPAFDEESFQTPLTAPPVKKVKSKPSFANAAHMAALKAKAKLEKERSSEAVDKDKKFKKVTLNADR